MPQLVTDRLMLRPYRAGEAELAHRLLGDPRVTFWRQHPVALEETQARLEATRALAPRGLGWWAAFLNDAVEPEGTPVFVGQIILQPLEGSGEIEIGWHVLPEYRGRGYASEAAWAVLDHAFGALALARVVAAALPDNARSLGVIHRLGFRPAGEIIHAGRPHRYFVIERHEHGARPERAGAALE